MEEEKQVHPPIPEILEPTETPETPEEAAVRLAAKEQELAQREEQLKVEEAAYKNAKERLYDKIHISPKALDWFIGICFVLILFFILIGRGTH